MTSRWMMQVKQRQRQFQVREGNSSMTDGERRFYRRKVMINPKTGQVIKVESIEAHIERMETEASIERLHPKEQWRFLARVLETVPGPFSQDERKLIDKNWRTLRGWDERYRPVYEYHEVERAKESVLRYRRLTGRKQTS